MKQGLRLLVYAFLIFATPIACGFLWGQLKANDFIPREGMNSSEIHEAKSYIVDRWTGSGIIWGMIFLGYSTVMKVIFWIIGGMTNYSFRHFRKGNGEKIQHAPPAGRGEAPRP